MLKTKEQRLLDYKKANKVRRAVIVKNAGYTNEVGYLKYLQNPDVLKKKKTKVIPTIHLVDISDASGSMQGDKYKATQLGIMAQINEFKNDKTVNYTYSLSEFVDSRTTIVHQTLSSFPDKVNFYGASGGNTPLYTAIFDILTSLSGKIDPKDKVLVKVYTDGKDNASRIGDRSSAAKLIKELQEKNFTITFVATTEDLEGIKKDLGLYESNTLAVENTGTGFERGFEMSLSATRNYSKKVLSGQSVKEGFYKKVGSL